MTTNKYVKEWFDGIDRKIDNLIKNIKKLKEDDDYDEILFDIKMTLNEGNWDGFDTLMLEHFEDDYYDNIIRYYTEDFYTWIFSHTKKIVEIMLRFINKKNLHHKINFVKTTADHISLNTLFRKYIFFKFYTKTTKDIKIKEVDF